MKNLYSRLGHLPHNGNAIDALNLVHDHSRLRYNDGTILVVNFFNEISFFDSSHLRIALDYRHPGLELPGLPMVIKHTTSHSIHHHSLTSALMSKLPPVQTFEPPVETTLINIYTGVMGLISRPLWGISAFFLAPETDFF